MSLSPTDPPFYSNRDALGRLVRLVRKELSEILRDRRTVITLVLMPLLLYPLLSIAFQQVAAANLLNPDRGKTKIKGAVPVQDVKDIQIAVADEEQADVVGRIFDIGDKFQGALATGHTQVWQLQISSDIEADVHSGKVDIGVRVLKGKLPRALPVGQILPDDPNEFENKKVELEIISLDGSTLSQKAVRMVERQLLWFHQRMVANRFGEFNPRNPIVLTLVDHTSLKSTGDGTVISLPALVPLILILMTITGAVYPAIDLTAGERERGTLEMLVAAPVPRLGLLFAKYVTVVAVAVLTGLVNLVGMTVTLKFSGLENEVIKGGLSPMVLAQVVALLLLFALFFSALLLSLTSFARSFKEAQSYLIPLMLVSLGPGIIGILPGVKLDGFMLVVPLVNIVLLGRDLFEGQMDPGDAILVVLVTLIYAGAAIALAARVFGAESVLYSEQSGWGDLFRRPEETREVAGVSGALWCLALMIPVHYVLQGSIHLIGVYDAAVQIVLIAVISVLLFLGFPFLSVWLGRIRLRTGFALGWPGITPLFVALILGAAIWPGVLWLLSLAYPNLGLPEQALEMIRLTRRFTPWAMLVAVVVPAIVEEIFFRGFLFSALRRVMPALATVLVTALLFGLMHVVTGGPFGTLRFWPSFGMGLLLGWVRLAGGSVWPGLVLHGVYNASMEIALQRGIGDREQIPFEWVLGSGVALVLGNMALAWTYFRGVKTQGEPGGVSPRSVENGHSGG